MTGRPMLLVAVPAGGGIPAGAWLLDGFDRPEVFAQRVASVITDAATAYRTLAGDLAAPLPEGRFYLIDYGTPVVSGPAVTDAAQAAWLRANRASLRAALTDAARYRDPEAGECGECDALNEGHRLPGGGRAVLCPDCSDDQLAASRWEALNQALEALQW